MKIREMLSEQWTLLKKSPLKKDVEFFAKTHLTSLLAWIPILGTLLSLTLVAINYNYEMPLATRRVLVTAGFGGLVYFLPLLWQGVMKDFWRVGGFYLPTIRGLTLSICVVVAWIFSIHYIGSLAGGTSFWRSMYLNGGNFHSTSADAWLILASVISIIAIVTISRVLQKVSGGIRWYP